MKTYRIKFKRAIKTNEIVYGTYSTVFYRGKEFVINEMTAQKLLRGETIKGSEIAGHGISVGYEYNINDISKMWLIKEMEMDLNNLPEVHN